MGFPRSRKKAYSADDRGMEVNDAAEVGTGSVEGGVEGEAGVVDAHPRRSLVQDVPGQVDLDEAGSADLVVEQAEGVDQHLLCLRVHSKLQNISLLSG